MGQGIAFLIQLLLTLGHFFLALGSGCMGSLRYLGSAAWVEPFILALDTLDTSVLTEVSPTTRFSTLRFKK